MQYDNMTYVLMVIFSQNEIINSLPKFSILFMSHSVYRCLIKNAQTKMEENEQYFIEKNVILLEPEKGSFFVS